MPSISDGNVRVRVMVEADLTLEDVTRGWSEAEIIKLRSGDSEARDAAKIRAHDLALRDADHTEIEWIHFNFDG